MTFPSRRRSRASRAPPIVALARRYSLGGTRCNRREAHHDHPPQALGSARRSGAAAALGAGATGIGATGLADALRPPGGAVHRRRRHRQPSARIVGARLSEIWGQQVVVENKPGAGGNIASEFVARADPDGHTLYITAAGLR